MKSKKHLLTKFLLLLALALTLTGVLPTRYAPAEQAEAASSKTELIISAAASLKDSLDEIEKLYEQQHSDIDLTFNYGSSGTLQKQIEQGAPADVFFSAGAKQMDALVKEDLIGDHKTLLKNELVMVVPSDSKLTFNTVKQLTSKSIKKIAIGQPESVPAGQYAQETLTKRNVWDTLKDKFVYAKDVRQVLTYVETGNVDAGFVYKTDALTSKKVKIALHIAPDVHTAIVYPAGVVKESKHAAEAKAFYTYLQSDKADAIFTKYGFKLG
ncbi:molybdate transport system substrate-binding protein [Paenibacillus cellulosilyticus]|uniref:Molybdate transport system substrate-binding protein n=1 Tax=Paenibacillus cellulosilyticus TaxID=375489 RepID=A0A2V2Z2R1_9BACL|nr:molybdate ABC transporter substrate-binding protein [Paenibacillus cellulosilyticus]PWW08556.1 molybdate transport system substrate-binding protein [Paenibacillus cellulosilyticus]QKS48130.1 molybdate ABC transporter substrate-binding protein [Paenibacillus cellulosilyticus]